MLRQLFRSLSSFILKCGSELCLELSSVSLRLNVPDLKDLYQGKPIRPSGHEEPSISLTLTQFRYLHIILIYSRLEHT